MIYSWLLRQLEVRRGPKWLHRKVMLSGMFAASTSLGQLELGSDRARQNRQDNPAQLHAMKSGENCSEYSSYRISCMQHSENSRPVIVVFLAIYYASGSYYSPPPFPEKSILHQQGGIFFFFGGGSLFFLPFSFFFSS
mgnify:CR=1 FL=1